MDGFMGIISGKYEFISHCWLFLITLTLKQENVEQFSLLEQKQILECIVRLNIIGSQSAGIHGSDWYALYRLCFFFTERLPHQADVSYDSTAGCVNGHNFLHVCKTWSLPFFSLSLKPLQQQNRHTWWRRIIVIWRDLKQGSTVFGPLRVNGFRSFCCGLSGWWGGRSLGHNGFFSLFIFIGWYEK